MLSSNCLNGTTMQPRVKDFFSEFHRQKLKPIGFKKINHTFSRGQEIYIERFNFQGSAWNSSDINEPWIFYINVGVQFDDLPLPIPNLDFPKTHWNWRIESLLRCDNNGCELCFSSDMQKFSQKLLTGIESASHKLTENIVEIRRLYTTNQCRKLSLPETFIR